MSRYFVALRRPARLFVSWGISQKEPKGTWSAAVQATYNSQTATSSTVSFRVQ